MSEFKSYFKEKTYRNRKLLDLAKQINCVNCGAADGTIVPAHANEGKGMRIKSSDATLMALCLTCHTGYDGGWKWDRDATRTFAVRMNALTLRKLIELELIGVIEK